MFLSGIAFYSARTLLKERETDLLNLRGLAQVRAVENRAGAPCVFTW